MLKKVIFYTLFGLLLSGFQFTFAADTASEAKSCSKETAAHRDQRLKWWRQGRFGMFIHWGIYSVPAGQWQGKSYNGAAEWLMNYAGIQVKDYEPLAAQFNPTEFDARQWVSLAKAAGMKYIVITSKHHDGFCMFDTKYTNYDIMDATPFHRDVLKELADECHRQGMPICWYHSIMDWHHPDYLPRQKWDQRSPDGADFSRYVTYMKNQLRELVHNYGKIGVLWFDGEWQDTWTSQLGDDLEAYVRSLDPNIIINNRVGKRKQDNGDFGTPEQEIPATGIPGHDWEVCMTMNDTWGYRQGDNNWKSPAQLIHNLVDIVSKGGNYLLNVGPTSQGLIPQPSVERLQAIGKWLQTNGESIYGTGASCFAALPWGRCTSKPGILYLHVFDWPADGKLIVPLLKNKIEQAYLLGDPARSNLSVTRGDQSLEISLPAGAPDPYDSVVVLQIVGEPIVVTAEAATVSSENK